MQPDQGSGRNPSSSHQNVIHSPTNVQCNQTG